MDTRDNSLNLSRRTFLKTTAASIAAACAVGSGCNGEMKLGKSKRKIPLGLQLYSVRAECEKDLPGTIKAVAGIGYQGVEFAGYYDYSAKDLRKLLDDNGLQCCGSHTQLDTLLGDHNPSHEFKPVDGQVPWDIFFGNTRKDVIMQFDTGNAMLGGGNAIPYLKRYPGRAVTVHLKEYSATNKNAVVGEGDIPWEELLNLCETIGGTKWYIIEEEKDVYPPLEAAERC